jgi:alkanesulfonate monooxygenase SsuD/methylene tetrahydromethanopterin reductase-like flavin-dependent oxidoreductase (luciferase family)
VATRAYNRFYRWLGYEEEAQAVLDAAGDRHAMAAALSDRVVDDLFCLGTVDEVAARVAAFCEAGVTVPVIQPLAPRREAAEATLWALADAWSM